MLKIVLSIIAGAILVDALAGYLLWDAFSPSAREAMAFGKANDDSACLDESLARLAACDGSGCQARSLVFAHLCFPVAAPSYQMCEDVPSKFLEAALWPTQKCELLDLPVGACERIHRQALKSCLGLQRQVPVETASSAVEQQAPFLGRVPSIDATITELRFYERGEEEIDYDDLDYKTRFSASEARYINWELLFEFPELSEDRQFRVVYYWPDTTVMGEMAAPAALEAGWTWSWQGYGWGWEQPGEWPPGIYNVEVFAEDQKVAGGSFTVE